MNGLKLFLGLVVLVAVTQAYPHFHDEWEEFKAKHGKNYESEEVEAVRKAIFLDNKKRVEAHNEKFKKGEYTFTVGLTHLSDLTTHEVVQKYNGYRRRTQPSKHRRPFAPSMDSQVPQSVDWRNQGLVTPVKNQQQCGGCWAFSSTGSIEGQHAKATGNLVSLSEQNLIDCSNVTGNMGCNGGLMDDAFKYVIQNSGIDTEASYPFNAGVGYSNEGCLFQSSSVGATISSFQDVQSGSEQALKVAVGTVGPVSVAIDASSWQFHHYNGGVFNDWWCSSYQLDHGVLAVGYGTDDWGNDYWIVKNSWGSTWGEQGYIRMARNQGNMCGIATEASYPIV